MRAAIAILIGLTLVAAWISYGYRARSQRIRLVVPDGFRGDICIEFDCPDGDRIRESAGLAELRIPASGRLRVRDSDPFLRWHVIAAQTQSGKPIPVAGSNVRWPQGQDLVWVLGTVVGREEEWFAVGSKAERDAGMAAKWRAGSKPATTGGAASSRRE
jgi:hypothetical protein